MSKDKIKIAVFGHKTIPSREGGIEIVIEEVYTRLVKRGYYITCFNRKKKNSKNINEFKEIKIKNVCTYNKKGFAALTSSFFAALKSAFGNYDIVHIHAEGPDFFSFIPKLFGKKVVCTIHGLDWQREKWEGSLGAKFIKIGEKSAVKFADQIIVLSSAMKDYFEKTYSRETVFIPNGVSKPEIIEPEEISKKYGLKKDDYILFLARVVPEKGLGYLVPAFKKLKTNKKIVIAGGASDTEEYMKHIKKICENDEKFIFTGFVNGRILEELYSNAYFYVLPSDLEGMPLSLLEAMSYGNCCLVSDIPECKEVVQDNGITFRKGNVKDLYNKMNLLCKDPEIVEKYKSTAAGYICNKYSWEKTADMTSDLYERLMR